MSMKKILMAAAAVTALSAGSASAITIDKVLTTVNTVSIAPTTNALGITTEPYTLASEVNVTSATNVGFVAKVVPSAALTQGNSYIVTFTIAGGTFETTGIATGDISGLGLGNSTISTGEVTSTKIQYVLASSAVGGTNVPIPGIVWTSRGIIPSTDKSPVTVTVSLANFTSPTQVIDGGAASATVLDFRQGLTFKATPPTTDVTLSIASGFKKFGSLVAGASADTTSSAIGTAVGFFNTGTANTLLSDVVYKSAALPIDGAVVTSADLTITGNLSAFDARVGAGATAQLADVTTGVIATLNPTNLGTTAGGTSAITLQQKASPVIGVESSYTVKPTSVVMSPGFLPGSFSAKPLGSVSFDGVNVYAPWVGDGANGISYSIRLGNRTATAIGTVKATLLNPVTAGTSGTVAATVACDVGSIPAAGELLVSSDVLKACFGSFKRSDVRLTVQASKDSVTAKMRTASAGVVNEATLGTGTSNLNGATN